MSEQSPAVTDDADAAIGNQTPVRARLPIVFLEDGTHYLDLTTKSDRAFVEKCVTFFHNIARHSKGKVCKAAVAAGIACITLNDAYNPDSEACSEIIKVGLAELKAKNANRTDKHTKPPEEPTV